MDIHTKILGRKKTKMPGLGKPPSQLPMEEEKRIIQGNQGDTEIHLPGADAKYKKATAAIPSSTCSRIKSTRAHRFRMLHSRHAVHNRFQAFFLHWHGSGGTTNHSSLFDWIIIPSAFHNNGRVPRCRRRSPRSGSDGSSGLSSEGP